MGTQPLHKHLTLQVRNFENLMAHNFPKFKPSVSVELDINCQLLRAAICGLDSARVCLNFAISASLGVILCSGSRERGGRSLKLFCFVFVTQHTILLATAKTAKGERFKWRWEKYKNYQSVDFYHQINRYSTASLYFCILHNIIIITVVFSENNKSKKPIFLYKYNGIAL